MLVLSQVAAQSLSRSEAQETRRQIIAQWQVGKRELTDTEATCPKHLDWQQQEGQLYYYWIQVPFAEQGRRIVASIRGNTITLEHCDFRHIRLWLNDELVNLDRKVKVRFQGRTLFHGKLERTEQNLRQSISDRQDPTCCFPACIEIKTCDCED